ncbi:MAG TPA: hypothetical protein VGY53_00515, partial [Isosphaeraceae bacterium]|nr:hypothetical protein [Isosphaeraceae bacterium]
GRVQGELHAAPSSGGQFEAFAYTGAPYGWYMRMWDSYTSTVFISVPYYSNGTYLFFYFHGYTYDPGQPTNTSLWRAAHDGYILVNPSSYSGYWATYYDHWSPTYGQSVSNPAWYQITFRF